MYVCVCRAIRESDVELAAREGATTDIALIARFGLDQSDACGRCARDIDRIVTLAQSYAKGQESRPAA